MNEENEEEVPNTEKSIEEEPDQIEKESVVEETQATKLQSEDTQHERRSERPSVEVKQEETERSSDDEGQEEEEPEPDFECIPDVFNAPTADDDVLIRDSELFKDYQYSDLGETESTPISEELFLPSLIPKQADEGEEGVCIPAARSSYSDMHVGTWEIVSTVEEEPERELYDCDYIKRHLGIPLVLGLSEITMRRPKDPVHFLGHWLFKWRYNQEQQLRNEEFIKALNIERELHLEKIAKDKKAKEVEPVLKGEDDFGLHQWPDIDQTPLEI